MCVPCLMLPSPPPGCCARLPLLLGVSAPEPLTLSLTQARLASPATQERKRTCLAGLVSRHVFLSLRTLGVGAGSSGPEVRAGDRDAALFSHRRGDFPSCASQGPGQHRDQAGERLARCHAGAPREVGRVTATRKEPCRPQGSVRGRVLCSCRGWPGAALAEPQPQEPPRGGPCAGRRRLGELGLLLVLNFLFCFSPVRF